MLVQAILVGLVGAFGCLDYQLGTLYAFRPIVLCPLVGLVLGDLQTGLAVGASLELLFMGSISIGAYVPPNETVGGVLACAFAIQLGQGTETAIALAMPIAVLALTIGNITNALFPVFVDMADKFALKGNLKVSTPFIGELESGAASSTSCCAAAPSIWVPTPSRACSTSSRPSSSTVAALPPTSCLPWASPCSAAWCSPSSSCPSTSWASCCAPTPTCPSWASPDRHHHRHRQVRPARPGRSPAPALRGRG